MRCGRERLSPLRRSRICSAATRHCGEAASRKSWPMRPMPSLPSRAENSPATFASTRKFFAKRASVTSRSTNSFRARSCFRISFSEDPARLKQLLALQKIGESSESLAATGFGLALAPRLDRGSLIRLLCCSDGQLHAPGLVDFDHRSLKLLPELEVSLEIGSSLGAGLARGHQALAAREDEKHTVRFDPVDLPGDNLTHFRRRFLLGWGRLLLRRWLRLFAHQAQAHFLLRWIDFLDHHLDFLADLHHVLGVGDAPVGQRGDVDQPIHARPQLDESAERLEADDFALHPIAFLELRGGELPRILLSGAHRERDAFLVLRLVR